MILLANFSMIRIDFGKFFKKNSTREIKVFVILASFALGYIAYITIITIYELSQGEKKILLFSIGYFTNSKILVLDNPFSGVGLIAKKEILNLLRDYMDENKMIILVTEDPLVIKSLADYVIVLENGRINTKEDIVELQERFNTTDIEKILLSIMKGEKSNV